MNTTDDNRQATEKFFQLANAHDVEAVAAMAHEDYIGESDVLHAPNVGRDAYRALLTSFWTPFPDTSYHIEQMLADGDTVITRLRLAGTHRDTFMGKAGTGRQFEVRICHVDQWQDGKIKRDREISTAARDLRAAIKRRRKIVKSLQNGLSGIAIGIALFASALALPIKAADENPFGAAFDAKVRHTMRSWHAPGVVVVVVRDGQTLHSKGYGTRVQGEERPVDSRTQLHIASHSKAVTATALAMLVDEGKLSWDDSVVKHIPELVLRDPLANASITLRDLVLHRSGLTGKVPGGFSNASYTLRELLDALKTEAPAAGFRERQVYSNVGIALAGEVVARVSGMSWEQFVRERIFVPLGMANSCTSNPDLNRRFGRPSAEKNIFLRTIRNKDGTMINAEWRGMGTAELYAPAGGIITTADDLAKWMKCLLRGGEYEGGRLLNSRSLDETWSPATVLDPRIESVVEAITPLAAGSLGWIVVPYAGRRILQAPGGFMGSVVALVPDERLGVAVATNLHLADRVPYESIHMVNAVVMTAIDTVLGVPERDWNAEFDVMVAAQSSRRKAASQ